MSPSNKEKLLKSHGEKMMLDKPQDKYNGF